MDAVKNCNQLKQNANKAHNPEDDISLESSVEIINTENEPTITTYRDSLDTITSTMIQEKANYWCRSKHFIVNNPFRSIIIGFGCLLGVKISVPTFIVVKTIIGAKTAMASSAVISAKLTGAGGGATTSYYSTKTVGKHSHKDTHIPQHSLFNSTTRSNHCDDDTTCQHLLKKHKDAL